MCACKCCIVDASAAAVGGAAAAAVGMFGSIKPVHLIYEKNDKHTQRLATRYAYRRSRTNGGVIYDQAAMTFCANSPNEKYTNSVFLSSLLLLLLLSRLIFICNRLAFHSSCNL